MEMEKIFESDEYNLVVFRVTVNDIPVIVYNSKANLFKAIKAYLTDNVVYLADIAFNLLATLYTNKHIECPDIPLVYLSWRINPDTAKKIAEEHFK